MRWRRLLATACLLGVLCPLGPGIASQAAQAPRDPPAPASDAQLPAGPDAPANATTPALHGEDDVDLQALVARWWQWAMALPVEPYLDPDGSFCPLGHQGDVWFLAGTDGTRDDIVRSCHVPVGVPMLLPVVNRYVARPFAPRHGEAVQECEQLERLASMPPEGLLHAKVVLDGVDLGAVAGHRLRSAGCFNPYPWLPEPEDKPSPLAASDGYWFLLEPLAPGRHVLEVDAHYRHGDFELVQRFRYVLHAGGSGTLVMHRARPASRAPSLIRPVPASWTDVAIQRSAGGRQAKR